MRQLVCVFVVLGLVVGLTTRSAQAQTTNGVTTGAERQALNDAYTLSEAARRANAPQSGSPGANKPLSTGSARPQTLTEKTAEMNALFGFTEWAAIDSSLCPASRIAVALDNLAPSHES